MLLQYLSHRVATSQALRLAIMPKFVFELHLALDAHTLLLYHRIIMRSRILSEPLELNSGNQHHGCDNLKSKLHTTVQAINDSQKVVYLLCEDGMRQNSSCSSLYESFCTLLDNMCLL
jgi:hypothetical protein